MKITPSFVLALAAASSASASPLLRRQNGGASSASSAVSAATSSLASGVTSRASSTAAAATGTPTGSAGAGSGSSNSTGSSQRFNDTQILQYALTLEHLEATFYNQSLSKLSTSDFEQAGYNSSVRNQIYSIGLDEAAHVEFLTKVLGDQSVPACTYNFSSVTDVESFLTTARVLEGVGVSAYLGAAQNITNGTALEAAGSILVVEGQHQSYLISQTDDGGNAIPAPFATPLDFKQVYSLAAPFIESCPYNLSLQAFPTLTLSGGAANGSYTPGEQVTVSYESSNSTSSSNNNSSSSDNGSKYVAFIQGITGPQFVSLNGSNSDSAQVTLPSNLTGGQFYAVITTSNTTVTDDNTVAGPAVGYINIPLPEAPEATSTASSSSSASSSSASATSSSTDGGATAGGAAGPTGTDTNSAATATPTASGSDSVVSTDSSSGSPTASPSASGASATGTQSLASSILSLGSANIPRPTNN